MKAVILIPWRSDDGPRQRNWEHVRSWWAQLGLPIISGDNRKHEFQRARARNIAAKYAGDWDVALFTDADIVLESVDQADAALMRTYRTGAYTVAYNELYYLTETGTEQVCAGEYPAVADSDERVGLTWECCFAVRRDVWDKVRGFDERFRGWGGQVSAFFYAYATFGGRERIMGNAYHLAHPLVDRDADPHFKANWALAERYKEAVDNPQAMTMILAERET